MKKIGLPNKLIDLPRDLVKAMAQGNAMNINSLKHWDICKALSSGKTVECVADDFKMPVDTVRNIKRYKCNCW